MKTYLWIALLCAGAVYFTARGPVRALSGPGSVDYEVIINALKTFHEGGNPYKREDILAAARRNNREWRLGPLMNANLLYAPGFLAVFYPAGYLDYESGRPLWLLLELAAVAGLFACAARLADLNVRQSFAFVTLALFFAPVHTGLAKGQPAIFFCLLSLAVFLALRKNAPWRGGAALGLLMIKPSFGVPACVVAVASGRWRMLVIGGVVGCLTWLPMVWRYGPADTVRHYYSAIAQVQEPGMDADDSRENPLRFDLINLRSWLYSCRLPLWLIECLYWSALGAFAWAAWRFRDAASPGPRAGPYFSLAAVFLCVAFYHRIYDAAVLVAALAAAVQLKSEWPKTAGAMALCLLPLAVPGTAALRTWMGEEAASAPWIEPLVVRHVPPLLLALAAVCWPWLRRHPAAGSNADGKL